jgi:hypothetical protein
MTHGPFDGIVSDFEDFETVESGEIGWERVDAVMRERQDFEGGQSSRFIGEAGDVVLGQVKDLEIGHHCKLYISPFPFARSAVDRTYCLWNSSEQISLQVEIP